MNDYLDMDEDQMTTVGEIIFVKNAKGALEIKEELLKWIAEHTSVNDNRVLTALNNYGSMLFHYQKVDFFANNPFNYFSLDEKRKIVAYIGSVYEPLYNKFAPVKPALWQEASTFENLFSNDKDFGIYLQQHHYFSLPALKNIVEPAD